MLYFAMFAGGFVGGVTLCLFELRKVVVPDSELE